MQFRWYLVAIVIGMVACSTPATRGSLTSNQDTLPVLMVDARTLRGDWMIFEVSQRLIASCMKAHGLKYVITNPGPEPPLGTTTAEVIGGSRHPSYGIAGPSVLRQSSPHAALAPSGGTQEDRYVRTLPLSQQDNYESVLGGPADALHTMILPSGVQIQFRVGGCVGQARAALFGTPDVAVRDSMLPQDVNRSFEHGLFELPGYREALSHWRACMVRGGYEYTSPEDAIYSIGLLAFSATTKGEFERVQARTAGADLRCDDGSHLRAVRLAALGAYLQRQSPSLILGLTEVEHARINATDRAETLLANYLPSLGV